MSKYSYNWRDSMRLRSGMLWKGKSPSYDDYPSLPKCVLLLLIIGILWAWVMDRDYAEQAASMIEHQTRVAEKRANQLGECIQGKARFITGDGKAIVCKKAEEFKI